MPKCQFLFSAIFGILENESQTSYFSRHEEGVQRETEEGQGLATP
jgi:hypothetical protein